MPHLNIKVVYDETVLAISHLKEQGRQQRLPRVAQFVIKIKTSDPPGKQGAQR